jgi:hypothetical protein
MMVPLREMPTHAVKLHEWGTRMINFGKVIELWA